jgi:hypothetical protein
VKKQLKDLKSLKKPVINKSEKKYSLVEAGDILAKSMYKAMLKTLRSKKQKTITDKIVEDIADPNYVAQVDPDEVPSKKDKVLYKGKSAKSQEKGIKKLKTFLDKKCNKDEPIPGLKLKEK